MSYQHLKHQAGMGLKALGETWEEVFTDGAKGMFALMMDLEKIKPKVEIRVELKAKDIPELFVVWLNELLAQKNIKELIFTEFKVGRVLETEDGYKMGAYAYGEEIDEEKQDLKTEVKTVTYNGLKAGQEDGLLYCQCVLDV